MPQIIQKAGKAAPPPGAALAKERPLPERVVGLPAIDRGFLTAARTGASDGTLSVGQGIQIKGEIESCETLVVEGRVEASLTAGVLKVRKGGLFEGSATVASAEIAGTFTGQLTVSEHLTVNGTGRISGVIRYRRIAVEDGGEISGDVGIDPAAEAEGSVPAKNNGQLGARAVTG